MADCNAAHNFFEPQPVRDVSVFFLRFVIHDWPNTHARQILKQLQASSQPSTKLILCDFLVPYAISSNAQFLDIPGYEVTTTPYPLLPNAGTTSNQIMMANLQVFRACFKLWDLLAAADVAFFRWWL